jgi:hypothetical protein
MARTQTKMKLPHPAGSRRRTLPSLALMLLSASCVPAAIGTAPELVMASALVPAAPGSGPVQLTGAPPPPDADPLGAPTLVGEQAVLANAALPIASLPNQTQTAFVLRARSGLDQARSLDCLSQAVYYEAATESEEGQRAVAQVVLNRMRHPSWPNSVCGVVYQGPMRAGGGCQFTFTCDGSLARRPAGEAWTRARRIAAEALSGRVFAPVGLSTHYHAAYVLPAWAPRLAKTATIGLHHFYRVPGRWGERGAISQAYAGVEPIPRPTNIMAARRFAAPRLQMYTADMQPFVPGPTAAPAPTPQAAPAPVAQPATDVTQIREEFRGSGQWRADSPIQAR